MKFDIHIHSRFSDGRNTPREIVRYAKKIGLDGIAITDHDEIEGSLRAMKYNSDNFTVIPGIEVSAIEGHILCLGITEKIESKIPAREVIERTHELGGIAIAAHPYDLIRRGVGDLIFSLNFDAAELYNGRTLITRNRPSDVMRNLNIPVVGGSDAHSIEEIATITMILDNDPLESIRRGDVEIVINDKKLNLIKSYILRRFKNFLEL
ncbi:MAG: metal-dependent phosphoesterase [Candidatus Altiarchaeales archaeon]|nr:MAG: metal-dependent phosphoesterase [Candidatus Altiarchaeales archaeon]